LGAGPLPGLMSMTDRLIASTKSLTIGPQSPGISDADPLTVLQWLSAGAAVLVDVRETDEFAEDHISGAILSPLSMFEPDLFPKFTAQRVVLMCAVGKRSMAAAKQLQKAGYGDVINLSGGLNAWKDAGCPTSLSRAA